MRKYYVLFSNLLLIISQVGNAQTTVSYTGMGTVTCPASPVATIAPAISGLSFSQITRGTGVTCSSAATGISGIGFTSASPAIAFSARQFYTFSITSDTATTFTLSKIVIASQVSSGTVNCDVQYNINGGANATIGSFISTSTAASYSIIPATSIPVGVSSTINIFIVPYNAAAGTTRVRINNNSSADISITSNTSIVAGDLLSNKANGSWTTPTDWDVWNGTTAVVQSTATPTAANNVFILPGHTYTLPFTGTRECKSLTVKSGAKLYTNSSTNRFLNVYGDIICNGTIGNGAAFDGISFNIDGPNCVISGSGNFDCSRICKSTNFPNATTSLTFNMNANLRYNGTALLNNSSSASVFNVTIPSGVTITCPGDGTTNGGGNVAIDGSDGNGTGYMGGSLTVNGVLTISGTGTAMPKLYLTTNNINTSYPVSVIIGSGGIINTPSIVCTNSAIAGSSFIINSGGKLNITGEPATYTIPGTTNNTYTISPGATIEYSKNGNQSVYTFGTADYSNLICSGSGIKMLQSSLDVNGDLTLAGTTAIGIGNNTLGLNNNVSGTGTISGSASSNLTIGNNGTAYPILNFTSGLSTLQNFTLNTNAYATIGTALDIIAGNNPGSVTVANNAILSTNGNLTLKSDADGTAGIGISGGIISGNVIVERYITAHRAWRLLTAPFLSTGAPTINQAWQDSVSNTDRFSPLDPDPGYGTEITRSTVATNGYDQGSTNNSSLKYFTTSGWSGIPAATNTGAITDQPGYMLFIRGDRSIIVAGTNVTPKATILHPKGQLLIGAKTISILQKGFQLIGNPFASAINFNSIYNNTNNNPAPADTNNLLNKFSNTYYLWDPQLTGSNGVGGFVTLTDDGSGTGTYISNVLPVSPIDMHGRIESGSAFLINFKNTGTLTINESDKSTGSATVFRPSGNASQTGQLRANLYSINPDGSTSLEDGALVLFNNIFSDSVKELEDAFKITNFAENISINKSKELLSIEKRKPINKNDTVFYNINQMKQQHYVLELIGKNITEPGLTAFLQDSYKDVSIPVNLEGITVDSFVVTSDSLSIGENRFKLIFNSVSTPVVFIYKNITASRQDNNILVEWDVADEINIKQYEVEKSTDGIHFIKIADVAAKGNNASLTKYNWRDYTPATGENFYRIVSDNINGEKKYSKTVKEEIDKAEIIICNNPVENGSLKLQFNNMPEGKYSIRLFDDVGREIFKSIISHPGGSAIRMLPFNKIIVKGVYNLEIVNPYSGRSSYIVDYE